MKGLELSHALKNLRENEFHKGSPMEYEPFKYIPFCGKTVFIKELLFPGNLDVLEEWVISVVERGPIEGWDLLVTNGSQYLDADSDVPLVVRGDWKGASRVNLFARSFGGEFITCASSSPPPP